MKTMKIMFCTSLLCAAALYADDAGLLFKAAYDGYNTAPDVAVNREEAKGGIAPELQLRMNRDVTGGRGNSLTLTTPDYVVYPAA